jgi:transposase InsO family protein
LSLKEESMGSKRYSREFKEEAVRQVTERGYSVVEVATRIGVSTHSLYKWVRAVRPATGEASELAKARLENQKLKAENRRLQEERDILEKAAAYFARDPEYVKGEPSVLVPNHLQREFTVDHPNRVWVTDITYIRTQQGWVYLAAVMDLFSRKIVGWSMKGRMTRDLVLDAVLMAVWRRRPTDCVLVHSDQGSQYGSDDWHRFCRDHGLKPSMSRRGDCWGARGIVLRHGRSVGRSHAEPAGRRALRALCRGYESCHDVGELLLHMPTR